MIIDLPNTSTAALNKRLVKLRENAGLPMIGRVLTLIVVTNEVVGSESAIRSANNASREHPCRVIVVIRGNRAAANRLDAQIRVGGDAGASEVIVLRTSGGLTTQGAALATPLAAQAQARTVIHAGRTTATAEGKVFSADGKLVAHGTTTCIVFR